MGNGAVSNIIRVESRFRATEFKKYLDLFKLDCQVRNLTEKTIDVYYERLGYFFSYIKDEGISFQAICRNTIQQYILTLIENVSDETVNGRIRAVKRFFNFLCDEGLWEGQNPISGIKLLRTTKKVKPVVKSDNVQKLLAASDIKTFEGARNKVMILLFWDGMLRLNELLGLKTSDIDLEGRLIKVFGKGRKERMVPLGVKTLRAIHQYLIKWRSRYPGDHLICMRNGQPVTERHCHKIVQRLGEKVGIKLYPHLLRHSAATWYIRQGGNPAVLQKILGHTSLLVTQNYLHLSNADTVKSYDSFSPANCLRI
jgi:site-specific recombinase XerD